jgi:hypothetical protein
MKKTKTQEVKQVIVHKVETGQLDFCILGRTPMIANRVSEKARRELLAPKRRVGAARNETLKHDPYKEFLDSPYTLEKGPTLLVALSAWFKRSLVNAALDVPGTSKAEIGRLCWVDDERIPLYGIPRVSMEIVHCSDINRTPDMRTRAILPQWACRISVGYTKPALNSTSIYNLLASAGITQGIGDWRVNRGGNKGQFELVAPDDKRYLAVLKNGGRAAQEAAMKSPDFYDDEAEKLYRWFYEEMERRGDHDKLAGVLKNGRLTSKVLAK